jgi:hypothetical protein
MRHGLSRLMLYISIFYLFALAGEIIGVNSQSLTLKENCSRVLIILEDDENKTTPQ